MKLYGIKNCQSVTKSFDLLDSKDVSYEFVDYKKNPPSKQQIEKWIEAKGVDVVINKRGMMWKKLPESKRQNLTKESAIEIALETPTIIKRPVIEDGSEIVIGFDEAKEKFS